MFEGCNGSSTLECNDPTVIETASEVSIEIVDDAITELAISTCNVPGLAFISADCQRLSTSLFSTLMSPRNVQLDGMRPSNIDEFIEKLTCEANFSFEFESQNTEEVLAEAFTFTWRFQ